MYFHKAQEKPRLYGSFQDRQYSIWRNLEDIYRIDHKSEVLIIPLFWGLPVLDYSKFGKHGINHGATYKNGSLGFDGNNDYVNIADNASLDLNDDSMSFSVRIKPNFIKTADIHGFVFDKTFDNAEAYRLLFNESIDNFRFRVFTSSGAVNCDIEGGSWNINTWHHLAGSYDGSNMRIYWDGSLENTVVQTGNITTNNDPFLIGAGDDTIRFFNGTIDEVRISKVARTADQIALFHDRPWDLYRSVSRPVYFIPSAIMNQFQCANLGADLFNGSLI